MKTLHSLILKSLAIVIMLFMPTTLSAIVYSLYINNPIAPVTEGDYNGEKSISFEVYTGSEVQGSPYTFGYTVSSSGGATYPSDYTVASGTGSIAVGYTSTNINIPLAGDFNPESDETITVTIYSELENKYKSATGTIVDNDSRSIAIADASVTEGDAGTSNVTLTLTLTGNTASAAIPFTYSTIANTAVATDDFTGLTDTVGSFPANATTHTITVPIVGDQTVELTEKFNVKIATTSGVSISDDTAEVTINDNDKYRITIAAATNNSVNEGNSGTTNATYTASLNQPVLTGHSVSVNYTVAGSGTNPANSTDFGSTQSGTLTFSATQQTKTITVPINGDTTPETDETYTVTLSGNSSNSTITTATSSGTIKNDDSPIVSVGAVSKAETNANQTFQFPITLSNAISSNVDVYYTATIVSGDTASASDFTQITTPSKVTILAGDTTVYANVTVAGDTLYEGSETFTVTLSSPVNGVLHSTNYKAQGTITNDDSAPTLSIANASTDEGNGGTKTLTFTINQSAASGLDTTFNVSTSDGTAKTSDSDYVGFTNTPKSIAAGSTSTTITVTINGDTKYENDESFNVTLSSLTNATGTPSATGTITNDDSAPTVTISPKSQNEGNSDNTMNFTVTLSAVSGMDTTVTYKTTDGSATTSDTDYTGVTAGSLTISAGSTTGNAAVTIKGDNKYETNEDFTVTLTGATNATLHTTKTATGTITNDDSQPTISIADLSQNEGSGGGTTTFNLPVSLSNPSYQAISVKYSTSNGTADSTDFTAVSNATLNFAAGSTSAQNASVSVNADNTNEADETFTVTLNTPSNATISDSSATATIRNDDALTLTITPATNQSVEEGNSGTTNATYTVTLSSKPLTSNVTVKYTVSGTGTNQASTSDFVGNVFPTATLTFLQNTTALTQTITIPIQGDTAAEQDETYAVTLSNATGATISGTNPETGTIENDDTPMFRVYVGSVGTTAVSTTEGDSGDQNVNFRVVMTAKPAANATVKYTIAQCGANPAAVGTSATGKDAYRGTLTGTLTFTTTNWSSYQQLQVKVVGDTIQENDETYCVTLSNPNSYGTLHADSQAVGTIVDNDTPIVYISSPSSLAQSSAEGTSGTTNQNYTITLTKIPLSDVTVTYAAAGSGTNPATSGVDFTATSGTWTFPAGTTTLSKVISVPIKGDTTPEPDETYTFTLSNVINASLSTTAYQATGTILNDDTDVTINDITVTEGSCGDVVGNLTVTLSRPINTNLTINYNSSGGTATENSDYTSVDGGSITITAGQTTGSIPVTIRYDDDLEPTPETFNVVISNANSGGVTYSDKTGVVTINDNQNRDITTFADQSVTEGDSGQLNMTFSVVLCQAAGQNYTFSYQTADITAEDGGGATSDGHNDYDGTATGSFQITAGNTTGTFNIPINGDLKLEPNETFRVTVTPPSGVTMNDTQAIGTIYDNDNRSLSINSISIDEGNSGMTTATLRISSTQIADIPIVVNYSTRNGTATKENDDYVEKLGTTAIPIGQTYVDVNFEVVGDTAIEPSEYFEVNISNPQGINVATAVGTITINDDDNRTVTLSTATVTEGDSATQILQIPVNLNSPLSAARILYYYTTPITANQSDDSDYVNVTQAENKSITLTTGTTSFYIPIEIKGDLNSESTETFSVTITSPDGLEISGSPSTITINDNDSARSMGITSATVSEGDSGTTTATLWAYITTPASVPVEIFYSTKDGTATTANNDYVPVSGSVVIPAGDTFIDINVSVVGDTNIESTESLEVNISNAQGIALNTSSATITINDDDNRTITFSNKTVSEGDTNTTVNMTITLNDFLSAPSTLYYYTSDSGTAKIADDDYVAIPQVTPGSISMTTTSKTFNLPIQIKGDLKNEGNEYLLVTIYSLDGLVIPNATRRLTLSNDDNRQLSVDSKTVSEGNADQTVTLTFSTTASAGVPINVTYSTRNGTATHEDGDYTQISGTTQIPATASSVDVSFTVKGDYKVEGNEYFEVNISNDQQVPMGTSVGTITINDDDNRTLTLSGITTSEGDDPTKVINLSLDLNGSSPVDRTIYVTTTNGSATGGSDFVAMSAQEVVIPASTDPASVPITIIGDIIGEDPESFTVSITSADGFKISGSPATVNITDDDKRTLTINSMDVNETEGSILRNFTVSLNQQLSYDLNITYQTIAKTAIAGEDFTSTAGSVIIEHNTTSITIPVEILGDYKAEADEYFEMNIGVDNIDITPPASNGKMTLLNDDGNLSLVSSVSMAETNTSSYQMPFEVRLSKAMNSPVTFRYWTTDKEANASSGDYVAVDTTETFTAGETSKIIYVTINGDIVYEGDESFDLNISNDLGVTVTNSGVTGTLLEDDYRSISIVSGQSYDEGDTGYTDANITVTLSEISGSDANVSYTLSTSGAVEGIDFNATSGSITIPAGQLTAQIPLRIYGDITYENDENVAVHIETVTPGFTVAVPDGVFTIVNDDGYFTIDDKTVYEGNVSDVTFDTIVVQLTRPSTIPIDINYTMIANSATANVDYVSDTGSVRLNAGDSNVTIPLIINGDGAQEGPEYFTVRISNENNATITDTDGNVTIVDSFLDEMRVYDTYQRDFSLRFSKNLYGNYSATGAPIMCVLNAAGTECDWNYEGYLGFSNTALLNDDPSLGKTNSSSAELDIDIESGDNIVWAGLYWQGHIESNNVEGIDSNTTGWNIITFKTPDGNMTTVTAELSDENATDWYSFKTSINAQFPGFRFFYQGFSNVTDQVRSSLLHNTGRLFTVGGMNVTVGEDHDINDPSQPRIDPVTKLQRYDAYGRPMYNFGRVGHFGGWTLVVVREKGDTSNPDDLHNVSIFDGYKYLVASYAHPEVSMDIGISGFKTPSSMPTDGIDSQLLYFGGGSEKKFAADELNISNKSGVFHTVSDALNPSDNPLNDTISFKGTHINTNRIYNPGIDLDLMDVGTHLETNQSNTTVRLTAKSVTAGSDQTFAGLMGFSTQLYQPQLCYDFTHEQNGVHLKNVVGEKDVPTIQGRILKDYPITTGIYLRNIDSDFAIKGMSFFTDMNASKIRYDLNSTKVTRVNGVTYGNTLDESSGDCDYEAAAPSDQVCLDSSDIRVGMGQRTDGSPILYTKETAGDIDSGSFQYVQFKTVPYNMSGDVNESLGLKLDYYIDLENGDGEITVHYTLGKNVKLCPATPIYQPQWGRFNIVDSNTSNYYNLYTQVANKDFNVSAAFYTQDGGGEYTVLANGDTTVIAEIIDVDAYHDINASCANPAAAVSDQWMLRFDNQAVVQLPTQAIPRAVKNAAYRIWWFDTGSSDHTTLAQGWSATTDAYGAVTGISDLYQETHTECTSTCNSEGNTSVACYNCIKEYYSHPICSRDNFSIRPESFDIRIRDIDQTSGTILANISEDSGYVPDDSPVSKMNLASGYTYRYDVNATHHTGYQATAGYTRYFSSSSPDTNVSMIWDPSSSDKNSTVCNSIEGKSMDFDLVHGAMTDGRSFYDQVGEYRVNMVDYGWTAVDFNDGNLTHHSGTGWLSGKDCIEGSADVSNVADAKKGCIISSAHATSNASVTYKDPQFVLKPYRFDLSSIIFEKGVNNADINTTAGATNFLYMADILDDNSSQMSLKANGNIRALSYNDANVSNFVSGCYAEDINLSLFRTDVPTTTVAYKARLQDLNSSGSVIYDANLTNIGSSQTSLFTIGEGNFTKAASGATIISMMMNYDRNASKPENMLVLGFDDLNVSCSSSANCQFNALGTSVETNGTRAMDFNISHVYGRFIPRDIRAFGNRDFSASGWYEVYNKTDDHTPLTIGTTQLMPSKNGAGWYINTLHDEAIDGDANVTRIQRNSTVSTVNMSSVSSGTGVETYEFGAVGEANIPYSAKAHVDIVPWLWYGLKTSSYSDPSNTNTDCLTHPCFNVIVMPAIGASGSSKGTLDKSNKASEKKGNGWHSTSDYAPAIQ